MESRSMELTLISVRDLNNTNILSQTKAYAVAWISNDLRNKQRKRLGKQNVMKFTLDEAALQQGRLVLEIVIYADATLGDKEIGRVSDKEIGRVSVPLKEFLRSAGGNKGADYPVRKPSGKAKGVLNLSVKLEAMPEVKQEFRRSAGGNKGADYPVRKPSGKAKGVLNPSVKLAAKPEVKQQRQSKPEVKQQRQSKPEVKRQQQSKSVAAYPAGSYGAANAEPVTAFPAYPPPCLPPNNQYPPPQYPPQAGYPPPPYQGCPLNQGYPPYPGYPPVVPAAQQPPKKNNRLGMYLEGFVFRTLAELLLENIVSDPYGGGFNGGDFWGGGGFNVGDFLGGGFDAGF